MVLKYRYGNENDIKEGKIFSDLLLKSLLGDKRSKERIYPYWWLDYYYGEVTGCIRTYHELKKAEPDKANTYLNEICIFWAIPPIYKDILATNSRAYKKLALQIMIEKSMIPDEGTFNNCIAPKVNRLKELYPYLRLIDPVIERLLDLPTIRPDVLIQFDIWSSIDNFDLGIFLKNHTE